MYLYLFVLFIFNEWLALPLRLSIMAVYKCPVKTKIINYYSNYCLSCFLFIGVVVKIVVFVVVVLLLLLLQTFNFN